MSPLEIAHTLQDPTPKEVDFTVLEGWRLEEIAASLPTSGLEISPQEFLDATRQPLQVILSSMSNPRPIVGRISLPWFL
jgi:cell division protein YceG involved in septum cleavage